MVQVTGEAYSAGVEIAQRDGTNLRVFGAAKAQGVDFNQVLVRFALERILYRLTQPKSGSWTRPSRPASDGLARRDEAAG